MTSATDSRDAGSSRLILCFLILIVLFYTAMDGVWSGWDKWLPGPMSRTRDAEAVGITAIAYGEWRGYASYRAVNKALFDSGLNVHQDRLNKLGVKHYLDVMIDPHRLEAGLRSASTLSAPEAAGMYYAQDENGLALFYVAAFALFGITSASWYWLYMSLYAVSVLTACIAFRRRANVVFFLLVVVCAHALVSHLLPTLPRDDVNLIHAGRFLGIMASVAMFHLMFLLVGRDSPRASALLAAVFQALIICMVINARTSAAWIPIAIALLWGALWVKWVFWSLANQERGQKPTFWPVAVLCIALAGFFAHKSLGQDEGFRDGRGGHVFWHSIVTAVHNHPERTARYGIPAAFPVFDDQVGYLLFDREIARRGENRKNYLMDDEDWIYRTTSRDLDFRWAKYDRVLRDVLQETLLNDPWYVIYAIFVEQPKSAVKTVFGRDFLWSRAMVQVVPLVAYLLGIFLYMRHASNTWSAYWYPLGFASIGVLLPVVVAAVFHVRVIELFYILLVVLLTTFPFLIAVAMRVASRYRR